MKPVRLARLAQADLADAQAWYDAEVPGLGDELLVAVKRKLAAIGENPKRFAIVHRDVRRALVERFPYGVFFQELDASIRVLAVVHLARHPSTWRTRMQNSG